MTETMIISAPEPGRRRRFTLAQKRTLLLAAEAPGASISQVARRYGSQPSVLFQWRQAMENGEDKGLESGEDVVPATQRSVVPVATGCLFFPWCGDRTMTTLCLLLSGDGVAVYNEGISLMLGCSRDALLTLTRSRLERGCLPGPNSPFGSATSNSASTTTCCRTTCSI